jgi:predicted nucleic acid-binding protein
VAEKLVVDASAMVDYLVKSPLAPSIGARIASGEVHVPAHFDAEVLSALGRLNRAEALSESEVEERLELTAAAPFRRHLLVPLLPGAWRLRHNVRGVDALYIELAIQLEAIIITTDAGMASASPDADLVGG